MHIKFPSNYWSHPQVEAAAPEIRAAGAWLLTNDRIALCGHCAVTQARFAFETGVLPEGFARALEALSEWFTPTPKGYFIPGFIGLQIGRGDSLLANNLCKGLVRGLQGLNDPAIVDLVVEYYPELIPALKVLSAGEPLASTTQVERVRVRVGERVRVQDRGAGEGAPGSNGQHPPPTRSRKAPRPGARLPDQQPEPSRSRMLALNAIFRRRPETAWSAADVRALEDSGLLLAGESDFVAECDAVRAFYLARLDGEKERVFWRRTTLQTLLNNWAGELDKARRWARETNDGIAKL